jgi:alkyl sulfatase BDS1-like metallo-beta-lactamase superfamily hydrolase
MNPPTYHPELKAHVKDFDRKLWQVTDTVYSAVGFGMANCLMIDAPDGLIIIDTLACVPESRAVLAEFHKHTSKPVKAIILTHHHSDHTRGAGGFADRESVGRTVDVYAHARLEHFALNEQVMLRSVGLARALYMYGWLLPESDDGYLNAGLGPRGQLAGAVNLPPSKLVREPMTVDVAGARLELFPIPSETEDQIAVYYPRDKVLFSAEAISPTFPNLYTLRGARYRDPVAWCASIDRMRGYDVEHLCPSHGNPILDKKRIREVMTAYRDMIQWTHDQTVRRINDGWTPDEIAADLVLPEHLSGIDPYGREFYGTVKHVCRNIYGGYLGWFDGDPAHLDPLPPKERAKAYVNLAGGSEAYLAKLRQAAQEHNWRWLAEAATWLIRAEPGLQEARLLKAQALRQLGFATINASWRNWYLTSAMELANRLPDLSVDEATRRRLLMVWLGALTVEDVLSTFGIRLDAAATKDVHMILGLTVTDRNQSFALEIRRGIVELHRARPAQCDVSLEGSHAVLVQAICFPKPCLAEAIQTGQLAVVGRQEDAERFLGYFDPPDKTAPLKLAGR